MTPILIVAVMLVGAAYWLIRRGRKPAGRLVPESKSARSFGAVEIRLRTGACEAACALEGQRFLASEAPALPLPKCTAVKCTCAFAKHTDRRTDDDRRFEHGGLGASMFQSANRRAKRDRRTEAELQKRR